MDRNTIIGFSLIFLILIGYYWWTAPSEADKARELKTRDSIEKVEAAKAAAPLPADSTKLSSATAASTENKALDSMEMAKQVGGFSSFLVGTEQFFTLKNNSLSVKISNKGGRLAGVQLNNFKRSDKSDLVLIDPKSSSFYYEIMTPNGSLRTDAFYWKAIQTSASSLTLRLENGKGAYIDQIYTLNSQDFMVNYRLELHGMQNEVLRGNPDLKFTWAATTFNQEKDLKWESQNSYVAYKLPGEDIEKLSATDEEGDADEIKGKMQWVSFKQQYFNSTLMSKDAFDKDATVSWKPSKAPKAVKDMKSVLYLDYGLEDKRTYDMAFYFGPNKFETLKNLKTDLENPEFQNLIPMGWGIFGWVNRFVVIPVFNFLDDYVGSMGIIILLLTLIIKSLLLPLVYKSYISTAKMRILKPELDEIKAKHDGDLQKMQTENMALYRKAGVSPMSGCVPMLLQMPILFALFQFFPNAFELRQQAFLWSNDLSQYDSILNFGFTIPFYGDHVSLFTLLMTVSTLIYTRLNNQISGVTGQMKWIGYFMPIIFLGVLNDYASGLTWYYFLSNMVTFGQQAIIRRTVNDAKLHEQIANARKKPVKKSAFAGRLETAMKQAQAKQQANQKKLPPKKTGAGPKKK